MLQSSFVWCTTVHVWPQHPVWSWHNLLVNVWVLSGFSKNIQIRWIGYSKCECECCSLFCLSLSALWWTCLRCAPPLLYDSRERLQPPRDPECRIKKKRKKQTNEVCFAFHNIRFISWVFSCVKTISKKVFFSYINLSTIQAGSQMLAKHVLFIALCKYLPHRGIYITHALFVFMTKFI